MLLKLSLAKNRREKLPLCAAFVLGVMVNTLPDCDTLAVLPKLPEVTSYPYVIGGLASVAVMPMVVAVPLLEDEIQTVVSPAVEDARLTLVEGNDRPEPQMMRTAPLPPELAAAMFVRDPPPPPPYTPPDPVELL